ncbi:MAG: SCO1664 family protein [Chloroflexi bacterium]|nr:SCO1664 family protein [Chloroflexota bacterium]
MASSNAVEQLPIPGGAISTNDALAAMRSASGLHPIGRLTDASNATFLCELEGVEPALQVIYKPIRGERPLWDFPEGTLAGREVAAFEVSEALGLHVVPPTILRDGPAGEGAVQLWIEHLGVEAAIAAVNAADASLRPIALFDAIVNNGDRKAGHLLPISATQYLGVDHGVTFSTEPKLRTVLWEWRSEPLNESELVALHAGTAALASNEPGGLNERLAALISAEERDALRARTEELLERGTFPEPSPDWPPLPWPLI